MSLCLLTTFFFGVRIFKKENLSEFVPKSFKIGSQFG